MAKISKVAHVVLNVRDPEASAKFYAEALGMEVMDFNKERQMAFLSFGELHHDIALFKAPEGLERSELGLNHIAMQIEGGEEELRQLYGRVTKMGARIDRKSDHGLTRSVFFFDPDGNRLEIFCEMMEKGEARDFMRSGRHYAKPMEIEPITSA